MDISESTLALITPVDGNAVLLTQPLSFTAATEKAKGCHVRNVGFRGRILSRMAAEMKKSKMKRIGFDNLTISAYLKLTEDMKGVGFKQDQDVLLSLRRKKDPEEVASVREAAKLADSGVEAGLETVKSGIHEYEVAAEIEYAM